jgi:F-type H+-transporting ATPase subunit delta
MVSEKLGRRYASAVFSAAGDANAVDRVGSDLSAIAAAFDADPLMRDFFLSPVIPRSDKERALLGAFQGKIDEVALHSLILLVRKRREPVLSVLVSEYRKLQMASRGTEPLTITAARKLDDAELSSLVDRLQTIYGKKFEVRQVVDPNLIGGVRITMGDRRIDGTISGQLDALARTLFSPN